MAAISAIVLATVQQGSRIVASNRLYGRTINLFEQELPRFGVKTVFVDTNDLDQVRRALQTPTRLLFVETISNPLLRVADLRQLAQLAREADCLFVVDNTFATPVMVRPLELGADFVMESLTKMIGGHSDITLGLVAGKEEFLMEVSQSISIWGLASNPFDCWLAERGLSTLVLRMRTAMNNAGALGPVAHRAEARHPRSLSWAARPSRSRAGHQFPVGRPRQHALFRAVWRPRGRQSFLAPFPPASLSVPPLEIPPPRSATPQPRRIGMSARPRNSARESPMASFAFP